MPVLDAQALRKDPEGSAFLLGVLCRTKSSSVELARKTFCKASKRDEERVSLIRQRLEALQDVTVD